MSMICCYTGAYAQNETSVSVQQLLQEPDESSLAFAPAVQFYKESGAVSQIEKLRLTYYGSPDCSGTSLGTYTTPDTSDPFPLLGSNSFSLNAASAYKVAQNKAGIGDPQNSVHSVLVTFSNLAVTNRADFAATLPAAATCNSNGNCCVPVGCFNDSQTCTNNTSLPEQPFVFNDPTAISISAPLQQSRVVPVSGSPLALQVTNTGSATATSVTISNKGTCPNLSVDASNCINVAPSASCTLQLSSSTPYAPCTITVSGSNTSNSPTALIAFSYLGGLVFQGSGGSGKVVVDVAQEFSSRWTNTNTNISGATSLTDGVANTNAIVAQASCSSNATNQSRCAAYRCRNLAGYPVATWYLPARDELSAVHNELCSNALDPCNFSIFSVGEYWSSSQINTSEAWAVYFQPGNQLPYAKNLGRFVRCVRAFTFP